MGLWDQDGLSSSEKRSSSSDGYGTSVRPSQVMQNPDGSILTGLDPHPQFPPVHFLVRTNSEPTQEAPNRDSIAFSFSFQALFDRCWFDLGTCTSVSGS